MEDVDASSRTSRRLITSWSIWIAYAILIAAAVLWTKERTVTNAYRLGVERWTHSQPLYDDSGHGFIYFPQAALTFLPWSMLPYMAGEITWRWCCIGLLALSVAKFIRFLDGDACWFLVATVVSVAMSWATVRAGQSTVPMTGLMILSVMCVQQQRWWTATWLLIVAVAMKPLAIVLTLLLAAIFPAMLWRVAVGFFVMAIVPFAAQTPAYVLAQYQACTEMLRVAYQRGEDETEYWAQLFGLLKIFGVDVPSRWQGISRMVAAVVTLGGCWWACRRLPSVRSSWYLYAFSACYLMLFNPRTEGNTYALVGPLYGIALAEAWFLRKDRLATISLIVIVIGTVGTYEMTKPFLSASRAILLAPLMCVGFTAFLITRLIYESQTARTENAKASS